MSLTIGRVGAPTAEGGDGFTFPGPETWVQQGGQVTVGGHVYESTHEAAVWRAKQIVGLGDGDEPVVPCTFTDAPGLDGYYRVVEVAATYQMVGTSTHAALVPWSATLEQVTNYRQPQIEVATAYGLRTNGRSITSYDAQVGFPGDAAAIDGPFTFDTSGSRSVGDGSGNAVVYLQDSGITTAGAAGVARFIVTPAQYYVGGCRIEHDLGSSTWRHAVGRPDFPPVDVTASPNEANLRLGNGLVRATFTYGNSSVSEWSVEWWDGSQWDAATEFAVVGFGTHGELTLHSPSVLRNTAEMCSVRFRVIGSSLQDRLTLIDFTVRRGQRWVTVHVNGLKAPTSGWRIQFQASTASTALTGGIRRTSNNGGGNREILVSTTNATADTTNGRLTTGSITTETFGVGCEVGGSGASGQNTAANQVDEWFCALSERALVVAN